MRITGVLSRTLVLFSLSVEPGPWALLLGFWHRDRSSVRVKLVVGINSFPASSIVRRPAMRPLENPRLVHVLDGNCVQGLLKRVKFSVLSVLTYTQCTGRD